MVMLSAGRGGRSGGGGGLASLDDLVSHFYTRQLHARHSVNDFDRFLLLFLIGCICAPTETNDIIA